MKVHRNPLLKLLAVISLVFLAGFLIGGVLLYFELSSKSTLRTPTTHLFVIILSFLVYGVLSGVIGFKIFNYVFKNRANPVGSKTKIDAIDDEIFEEENLAEKFAEEENTGEETKSDELETIENSVKGNSPK